ncbi:MAG: UDP-glucose/GDP-mannose dehydrogenase family protein [Candidatus Bipolaricaulia bacterium]
MNIGVIGGAGYVGLVTGLGFAELGHHVTSVDVNEERIKRLQSGQTPIHEEGLLPVLERNLGDGNIEFSTSFPDAVEGQDVVFIAVGTPAQDDGQADLSQVIEVAERLVDLMESYTVVVIKSTVPVGTVELVQSILNREKAEGMDFDIVSNPEFLREGKGMIDFFYPDRIVVGTRSERAREAMHELYRPLIAGNIAETTGRAPLPADIAPEERPVPLVETDLASAQMIKYASNAFLATRISFINEIARLCEEVDANINEVARGMGYDPRIGSSYLDAGLGFGGPCLEKDLKALIKIAEANDYEPRLLREVLGRNDQQVREVIGKVKELTGYLLYKKIVAVWGLAFKSGTNDVRNSLAFRVVEALEREGAEVQAHDPMALDEARALHPNIHYFDDPYEAAANADAVVLATDWPQYAELDFDEVKRRMARPAIVDGRNLLDRDMLMTEGFRYLSMGRA